MKRALILLAVAALAAVGVYWFALRGSATPTAEARPTTPVAQIGEGKTVILVGDDGRILGTRTTDANKQGGGRAQRHLVVLPLTKRPKGDRVKGHVLEEVHVIAATPAAIRRYIASAKYGETGVALETDTGIEIRFGDDREATRKWEAAAQVLADPSVTLLSYVDVTAPSHPAIGGEGHELPARN
ncbi:MAG TPA: cell division protein FtsQ/DivIB [Solirubrobacterales bacterium]|nr:cell division protein FtsQ/DivIB [Solirubrobacterales bacterium]